MRSKILKDDQDRDYTKRVQIVDDIKQNKDYLTSFFSITITSLDIIAIVQALSFINSSKNC